MQKIVLDTNVIVSSLIQRSYPYFILNELFIEDKVELCLSEEVLSEYYEVLKRPKFARFQDFFLRAEVLLANIESRATIYYPATAIDFISNENDNRILELAVECSADYIITGNSKDFTFSFYKQTKIVSPKEYWDDFQSK